MLRLNREAIAGSFHLALRSATLVLRFVLTFYIVKSLGYEASGVYGLAVGAIGIVPAAIGWGLNYFTARDVIGMEMREAASIIKTRLLVTGVSLAVCTGLALAVAFATGFAWSHLYTLILVLIWFETYALDIHMPLLALDMGRAANVLVFIRSAAWVPVWILSATLVPSFHSLTAVFLFWIASHVLALLALARFLRRSQLPAILPAPVRTDWLKSRIEHSWYIYISDLSNVGMLYADRYIVSYFLGIEITGLYTFYWSLTNALQTLVITAIVQVVFPKIYKSYDPSRVGDFASTLWAESLKVMVLSVLMGGGLLVCGQVAMQFLPGHQGGGYFVVFLLLTLAAVVRTVSEMLNIGLTTLKLDGHYAVLNVSGAILSLAASALLIWTLGFPGVGLAALGTALMLGLARLILLLVFLRRVPAGASSAAL